MWDVFYLDPLDIFAHIGGTQHAVSLRDKWIDSLFWMIDNQQKLIFLYVTRLLRKRCSASATACLRQAPLLGPHVLHPPLG